MTHEEADVIIFQQMTQAVCGGAKSINIIFANTGVFVLLLHYYAEIGLTCSLSVLTKLTFSPESTSPDIAATIKKQADMLPQLGAVRVLSGCDTVTPLYGIRKEPL